MKLQPHQHAIHLRASHRRADAPRPARELPALDDPTALGTALHPDACRPANDLPEHSAHSAGPTLHDVAAAPSAVRVPAPKRVAPPPAEERDDSLYASLIARANIATEYLENWPEGSFIPSANFAVVQSQEQDQWSRAECVLARWVIESPPDSCAACFVPDDCPSIFQLARTVDGAKGWVGHPELPINGLYVKLEGAQVTALRDLLMPLERDMWPWNHEGVWPDRGDYIDHELLATPTPPPKLARAPSPMTVLEPATRPEPAPPPSLAPLTSSSHRRRDRRQRRGGIPPEPSPVLASAPPPSESTPPIPPLESAPAAPLVSPQQPLARPGRRLAAPPSAPPLPRPAPCGHLWEKCAQRPVGEPGWGAAAPAVVGEVCSAAMAPWDGVPPRPRQWEKCAPRPDPCGHLWDGVPPRPASPGESPTTPPSRPQTASPSAAAPPPVQLPLLQPPAAVQQPHPRLLPEQRPSPEPPLMEPSPPSPHTHGSTTIDTDFEVIDPEHDSVPGAHDTPALVLIDQHAWLFEPATSIPDEPDWLYDAHALVFGDEEKTGVTEHAGSDTAYHGDQEPPWLTSAHDLVFGAPSGCARPLTRAPLHAPPASAPRDACQQGEPSQGEQPTTRPCLDVLGRLGGARSAEPRPRGPPPWPQSSTAPLAPTQISAAQTHAAFDARPRGPPLRPSWPMRQDLAAELDARVTAQPHGPQIVSALNASSALDPAALDTGAPNAGALDAGAIDGNTLHASVLNLGTSNASALTASSALEHSALDRGALDPSALDRGALDPGAPDDSALASALTCSSALDPSALDRGALDPGAPDDSAPDPGTLSAAAQMQAALDLCPRGPASWPSWPLRQALAAELDALIFEPPNHDRTVNASRAATADGGNQTQEDVGAQPSQPAAAPNRLLSHRYASPRLRQVEPEPARGSITPGATHCATWVGGSAVRWDPVPDPVSLVTAE